MKEYVKKVNIHKYIKNYKVTSNRNVKPHKEKICKSNKYIEMIEMCVYTYICIYIYIYIYIYNLINAFSKNNIG